MAGEKSQVGHMLTNKSKISKRVSKQLKEKTNLKRPMRVMPKKLGFKMKKKQKVGKKSSKRN